MTRNLTRAAQAALKRHGEDVTLTRHSRGGTDSYGDPTFTETTETVRMALGRPSEASDATDAAGADVAVDLVGHTSSDHAPITGKASGGDSNGDPTREAEITRSNGDRLEVIDSQDEANGLLRLELSIEERGEGGAV